MVGSACLCSPLPSRDTARAAQRGCSVQDVRKEDFPLPRFGPRLEQLREEITRGRGFAVVRGLPVWRLSRKESVVAYWGIGTYLGKALSNNKKGHLVGHIKVRHLAPRTPATCHPSDAQFKKARATTARTWGSACLVAAGVDALQPGEPPPETDYKALFHTMCPVLSHWEDVVLDCMWASRDK
jgi:hypothetical protein